MRAFPSKWLAKMIGQHLDLPVESREADHFGWFAKMASADMAASSLLMRELLDWQPEGPSLLTALDQGGYYAA